MTSSGTPEEIRAEEIRAALRRFRRRRVPHWGSRRAAMAVIVLPGAGGPEVLLTRRRGRVGIEHGQLGLPCLRADRWESAAHAARDRIAASLGLRAPSESVLGQLDTYVTDNKMVITPVVLWVGPVAAQRDCASGPLRDWASGPLRDWASGLFTVPLTDLDVEPVFQASAESDRPMIRLPVQGEWLHAPTAAVLHQFREVVLHHRATRVAHLGQPTLATR